MRDLFYLFSSIVERINVRRKEGRKQKKHIGEPAKIKPFRKCAAAFFVKVAIGPSQLVALYPRVGSQLQVIFHVLQSLLAVANNARSLFTRTNHTCNFIGQTGVFARGHCFRLEPCFTFKHSLFFRPLVHIKYKNLKTEK